MNLFSKLFRSRDKPKNYLSSHWPFVWGATPAGKNVTERTAMQVTAVYACVRILAEAIASLPLHVYQYRPDGSKEKLYSHCLYRLLHDEPNPEMTSFVFRETMMSHLLLWGNAYAQIIRNGRGEVTALYPLLPNKMDVSRDSSGQLVYTYTRNADESGSNQKFEQVVLPREDVLHIPGLGFDGLIGYSPITMAKNAIGIAIATEEYGAAFFANGATPGGILEHPGVVKDPDKLRKSWQAQFTGRKAHSVAVLEEGMTYKQMGIPPNEAQFLETRKFQINEIARIFRVPPHMVGDLEKSSFSNIEQQSLDFVMYTLNPWIARWEQALQQALLLPAEKSHLFFRFNVDGLLRGDYQSRMNGYVQYVMEQYMEARRSCTDPIILIEQRLDFSCYVPDGFGTGDCVIVSDDRLHIIDFKYGLGVLVEAENNPQMKLYALGALAIYDSLYDIKEVSMTIFQPRRENVSTWTISTKALKEWAENELVPKAELAFKGEGEYQPGEWCTFCRAAVKCRARAEEKLNLARKDFRLPPLLTDAEIEEVLEKLPDLTRWANAITAYATDAAVNHGKVWNGFKVVEGRSVRKYIDEEKVADAARKNGYSDIYRQSLIPMTEMQKLMGKKNFEEILGELIYKPPGKPTLVPVSDKRPAMNISDAKHDFDEI